MENIKTKNGSQNDRVLKFFGIEVKDAKRQCKVCDKWISTKKLHNLVSHFAHLHNDTFKNEIEIIPKVKDPKKYEMERCRLLQGAAELVAINGYPFSFILSSGYQKTISKAIKKCSNAGYELDLKNKNLPDLKTYISDLAANVRDTILQKVKNKYVSLMVDIAKKNYRSVIGISIQYVECDHVELASIGMKKISVAHTAVNIKEIIMKCLQEFGIETWQIISITTDNASNMISMINLFNCNEDLDQNLMGINGDVENDTENDTENETDSMNVNIDDDDDCFTDLEIQNVSKLI